MNEEKIMEVLEVLGRKLGVASEYIWEALIRQQYVTATQCLIWLGVLGTSSVILYKLGVYNKEKAKTADSYNEEGYQMAAVFSYIGCAGCVVGFVATLTAAVGRFVNPGYYALENIMKMF